MIICLQLITCLETIIRYNTECDNNLSLNTIVRNINCCLIMYFEAKKKETSLYYFLFY